MSADDLDQEKEDGGSGGDHRDSRFVDAHDGPDDSDRGQLSEIHPVLASLEYPVVVGWEEEEEEVMVTDPWKMKNLSNYHHQHYCHLRLRRRRRFVGAVL